MNGRLWLQSILDQFGQTLGVPVKLDGDQGCSLRLLDDELSVNIAYLEDTAEMLLFCPLGVIEAERRPALYEQMLAANFLWRGAAGATLSIEDFTHTAVLFAREPVALLDQKRFRQALEEFIEAARRWADIVEGRQPPPMDDAFEGVACLDVD